MATTFLDNFDRADSNITLGPEWIVGSSVWGIESGQARMVSGNSIQPTLHEFGSSNVEVSCRFVIAQASCGLAVRAINTENYLLIYYSGIFGLFQAVNSSYTQIGASAGGIISPNSIIKVVAQDDQVSVYVNDTLTLGPLTTTFNQSATQHGMVFDNATMNRFDDFSILDLNANTLIDLSGGVCDLTGLINYAY